jgi:hypothetical protein
MSETIILAMKKYILAAAICLGVAAPALAAGFVSLQNPDGLTPFSANVHASSGNVANAAATATLPAPGVGLTNYVTGIEVTAGGATAAGLVTGTITGLAGGVTESFTFGAPAGVALQAAPFSPQFESPLRAAQNTAVVLTLPALGSGNTNATVTIHGYVGP